MFQLRLAFAAFAAWLFLFFNIERVHEPINIGSFAYLLTAACGLAVLLWPNVHKVRPTYLFLLALAVFLGLKLVLGYPIIGRSLPLTLTEFCALAVTIFLARHVVIDYEELRSAAFCNVSTDFKNRAQPFDSGQGELYREVRRARLFQRPLALLAIGPAAGTVDTAKSRFTEEVVQRMLRQYITARVGDLLSRRLKDCDVIAQRNCHFVAALPETRREVALQVLRRLQTESRQELGIELNVGLGTFPDEEGTFIGLLERAEQEMVRSGQQSELVDGQPEPEPFDQPAPLGALVEQATA